MKTKVATPFLKWAGGKTQLIQEIQTLIPSKLSTEPFTYVEPFVGSGAVLFWILNNYPTIQKAVINDINSDLINTYQVLTNKPRELFDVLQQLEADYHQSEINPDSKKSLYYQNRSLFNNRTSDDSTQAALFIFLNRTCFNGLYRVNRKNEFNVPIGSYKKPTIFDKENLLAAHHLLQKVEILSGDYKNTLNNLKGECLYYLDPPYKPLNQTSSFNAYANNPFDDAEQIKLAQFCKKLHDKKITWILSNSDMKNIDPNDNFFDDLYHGFKIKRVNAKRMINSNASKRGSLKELLITNNFS